MFEAPYYYGSRKLEGRVALITGGAGIGRAVAVLYARESAHVAIAHLTEDADVTATATAVEAVGRCCLVLKGDVRERDFCFVRLAAHVRDGSWRFCLTMIRNPK